MEKDCQLKSSSIACFLVSFGCIFAWGIGSIHLFDLDELYFAEITREMMRTGSYGQVTFNFEPLYEKPPLFFWLQAASMHLWGINEVGARFPNLLCGLLTLATLYYIGQQYKGRWFGFLWMCLYATAFLPHFYFKSGIIDPFFNYFLLTAIYFLSRAATPSKEWLYGCAGLSIGFALLAKGPMGFIIPLATLSLAYTWFKGSVVRLKGLILALLVATAVLSCWLIPEIWSNGCRFIKEFWDYHLLLYHQPVATHVQPWYYHYLVLFFGCFPSSLFAICFLQEKRLIRPLSKSICDQQFLGEAQSSTAAYSDVCEEHRQASTPKLPLEIEFQKRSSVELLEDMFQKIIFQEGPINDFLAMTDLYWDEHKRMVKKFLTRIFTMRFTQDFSAFMLFWDHPKWAIEEGFYNRLLTTVIQNDALYEAMIGQNAEKWDRERILLTDKLILKLALAELLNFKDIPFKVSINEYIEIAKWYGTSKSACFINGVLEGILKGLNK